MEKWKCVGVARTSLRDAPRSLLPRSGTTSSVTVVDIAVVQKSDTIRLKSLQVVTSTYNNGKIAKHPY
jgi:hypothetical protein